MGLLCKLFGHSYLHNTGLWMCRRCNHMEWSSWTKISPPPSKSKTKKQTVKKMIKSEELGKQVAFPQPYLGVEDGLTKREYFAAIIMAGLVSNTSASLVPDWQAKKAVGYADALLVELSKAPDSNGEV